MSLQSHSFSEVARSHLHSCDHIYNPLLLVLRLQNYEPLLQGWRSEEGPDYGVEGDMAGHATVA